ncbi:MAG: hypothetical protein HYT46_02330 [Candidatus Vogelbacteria bacterium]|nr:hypothetical protein [Candidatus Vogelbacteria bacterium]
MSCISNKNFHWIEIEPWNIARKGWKGRPEMAIQKILCVCIGNSDRSPVMAAVLEMFLRNAGHEVDCFSAGVGENASRTKHGTAAPFAVTAAKRIGLDISSHERERITEIPLGDYDLIVCASDEIAAQVMEAGGEMKKIYNAQITNPWPCQFQEDYDGTFAQILTAMYRVVTRYFSK